MKPKVERCAPGTLQRLEDATAALATARELNNYLRATEANLRKTVTEQAEEVANLRTENLCLRQKYERLQSHREVVLDALVNASVGITPFRFANTGSL